MTPQPVPTPCFGATSLALWLETHDVTILVLARAIGAARAGVSAWLRGEYRPDAMAREKIARFTRGDVPASAWLDDDDRAELAAIVPFERPAPVASAS